MLLCRDAPNPASKARALQAVSRVCLAQVEQIEVQMSQMAEELRALKKHTTV